MTTAEAELLALRQRKAAIEAEIENARAKALDSLGRYKFVMFGYWAGVWVHLNRLSPIMGGRPNPFQSFVKLARQERRTDGS